MVCIGEQPDLVPALQLLGQGQQGLHVPTAAAHQHRQAAARRLLRSILGVLLG